MELHLLPPVFFSCADVVDLVNLWLTSTSLFSRLNCDQELLLFLFTHLLRNVHTDCEEYTTIQDTNLLFFSRKGTFSSLITTVSRYYLSSISHRFLSLEHLATRACSYGRTDILANNISGTTGSCFTEAGKYDHVDVIKMLITPWGANYGWVYLAFDAACDNKRVNVVRYFLQEYNGGCPSCHFVDGAVASPCLEIFKLAEQTSLYSRPSALHIAARNNNIVVLDYLVQGSSDYLTVFIGAISGGHISLLEKYVDKVDMSMMEHYILGAMSEGRCHVVRWLHSIKDCRPFPSIARQYSLSSVEMIKLVRELDPDVRATTVGDITARCGQISVRCCTRVNDFVPLVIPRRHCEWCSSSFDAMIHAMTEYNIEVPAVLKELVAVLGEGKKGVEEVERDE